MRNEAKILHLNLDKKKKHPYEIQQEKILSLFHEELLKIDEIITNSMKYQSKDSDIN